MLSPDRYLNGGRTGVTRDISERCLAHVIGGVEGTYDRYDYLREKREAFDRLRATGSLCHPLKAEGAWRCCCWVRRDRSERQRGVVTASGASFRRASQSDGSSLHFCADWRDSGVTIE
jgi:hypothetical protein